MTRILSFGAALLLAMPAFAQEQQAGNAASADSDATFQALIDKCDDVDALMLRARIRLQIPRTTDEAAATAQQMLDEAFATCGGGDLEGAKAQLAEALAVAEAGTSEALGTEEEVVEASAEPDASEETETVAEETEEDSKPWWKFW